MNEEPPDHRDGSIRPETLVAWRAVHDPEYRARFLATISPEVHRTVLEVFKLGLNKLGQEEERPEG